MIEKVNPSHPDKMDRLIAELKMFYEHKTRSVIESKPDDYEALREKCISGEMARYYTCGIRV